MRKKLIMGIESTAHTFGIAIIDSDFNILSDIRRVYPFETGKGIHPQKAAEHHSSIAQEVLSEAIENSGISVTDLDGFAYSCGPGLGPSLRIGATVTRTLTHYLKKPIYPVHHGIGHIELASKLTQSDNPLVILVSGGHTAITAFNQGNWRIYGETLDIPIGNLFDQFARKSGLASPGGPIIEKMAKSGSKILDLPYTVKGNNMFFSGLMTSVLKYLPSEDIADVCYSLQEVAFSMLVESSERGLTQLNREEVVLAGGVASNNRLQEMMKDMVDEHDVKIGFADRKYNGDNGVQIAIVGLYMHLHKNDSPLEKADVRQRWRLDEVDIPWRK